MSANRVVASSWIAGSLVVSGTGHRYSVIEGILTCEMARHRRTLTLAKRKEGKKVLD